MALTDLARTVVLLTRSGIVTRTRPDKVLATVTAILRWGPTLAGGYLSLAARTPERIAIIDDDEQVTFRELVGRGAAIADRLRARGIRPGDTVALAQRNTVSYVASLLGIGLAGADTVLINTQMPPAQVHAVLADQDVALTLVDDECADLISGKTLIVRPTPVGPYQGLWPRLPSPPSTPGRLVVLTSGTTGTPKGARRPTPKHLGTAAGLLSVIPAHADGTTVIAAPLFHTWGLGQVQLATALRSTVVLSRRFTPASLIKAVSAHGADTVALVPVMLQRMLELPAGPALPSLRIVEAAGSVIPAEVVTRFLERYGDVLYNIYGSTEVSWATIATPAQLRRDPRSAGKPPPGTVVAIVDLFGDPIAPGEVGDVYVGNGMAFDGYTNAESKPTLRGLHATGDRGHLLEDGCLIIDGRSDDMVISGGENVYPRQTEDVLSGMPGVREVAVVGVPDPDFGQSLTAYVVADPDAEPLTREQVRGYVRQRLARFAVPRDVVFLDELPRNATGKVVPRLLTPPGPPATTR